MAVEPDSEKRPTICMCVKGSALKQRGKFCKVDSKNVVIVILEDIIANIVIVRFVIGWNCRVE